LWFNTTDYGDEKDRVVVRGNGVTTYFASDIAYHQEKFLRGYDEVIDVWGADHHGYIQRIKASIEASGNSKKKFGVILIQLVNLLRHGKQISMSTRSGQFISLKDVIAEVGKDAARFIFLSRHYESPLDFDLEIAKKKTNENPVYYVQYVHARISSILRKAEESNPIDFSTFDKNISDLLLKETEEIRLIKALSFYPDTVKISALQKEPHKITFYLMNLASLFHSYYNKHKVLTDNKLIMQSRLYLITAILKTIRNGLNLLGISAPEKM
jgi:arginyl-tRNA synthetase